MLELSVKIDDELSRFLDEFGKKFPEEIKRRMLLAAEHTVGEIRTVIYSKMKGRGGLARSFRATFMQATGFTEGGGFGGMIAGAAAVSDQIYAGIQDQGGTIRPRTGQFLAIPLKGAGVPPGKWPRHFPAGSLFRVGKVLGMSTGTVGSSGNRKNSKAGWRPLFALAKQVYIKPHHYLEEAAAKAEDGIAEILGQGIEAAAKESG